MKKILLMTELNRIEEYLERRDKTDNYNQCTNQGLYYQFHDEAYFKARDRRDKILEELGFVL